MVARRGVRAARRAGDVEDNECDELAAPMKIFSPGRRGFTFFLPD
jgi:hypothetical protein